MWVQAGGLFMIAATRSFGWWFLASVLLGLGTAMVYPTLIAAVSDASHPSWRARSLSVYRFWRDLGYAIGALSAGIMADSLALSWAMPIVAHSHFSRAQSWPCSCASGRMSAVTSPQRREGI